MEGECWPIKVPGGGKGPRRSERIVDCKTLGSMTTNRRIAPAVVLVGSRSSFELFLSTYRVDRTRSGFRTFSVGQIYGQKRCLFPRSRSIPATRQVLDLAAPDGAFETRSTRSDRVESTIAQLVVLATV